MSRPVVPASVALIGLFLACPALLADSPAPSPGFGDTSVPIDLSGAVTVQNCIGQALGRNFTVRIQQFNILESTDSVAIQQAAFEPTFGFQGGRQVTVTA